LPLLSTASSHELKIAGANIEQIRI